MTHDPLCLCEQCIDHDPLLDGIERYDEVSASPDGPFVLFTDHERALEDVRAAAAVAVAHARKDEREACAQAVEALAPLLNVAQWKGGYDCCGCSTLDQLHEDAVAAIEACHNRTENGTDLAGGER